MPYAIVRNTDQPEVAAVRVIEVSCYTGMTFQEAERLADEVNEALTAWEERAAEMDPDPQPAESDQVLAPAPTWRESLGGAGAAIHYYRQFCTTPGRGRRSLAAWLKAQAVIFGAAVEGADYTRMANELRMEAARDFIEGARRHSGYYYRLEGTTTSVAFNLFTGEWAVDAPHGQTIRPGDQDEAIRSVDFCWHAEEGPE